jgi:hypothetical protein
MSVSDKWALTWFDLTCESERLWEAMGEGGAEFFTQAQLNQMNRKSNELFNRAEAIEKAWNKERSEHIADVAIKLDKEREENERLKQA